MKEIVKILSKQLLGAGYERIARTLPVCLIVFFGLSLAGFRIRTAPSVLCLTVTVFTAGIMWQALSSDRNTMTMRHLMMLPFDEQALVLSCTVSLGIYTFFTRTALLLAVLLAVSDQGPAGTVRSLLCAVNAVLTASAVFSIRRRRYAGILWGAAVIAAVSCLAERWYFPPLTAASSILAVLLLRRADGYSFCLSERRSRRAVKSYRHHSLWRCFFRYLCDHENYLANTGICLGAACVLPLFLLQTESLFMVPAGFALLSLNTPICVLLSCDPALERAVRVLPGQKRMFCIPYCLFLFTCNLAADAVFLVSLHIVSGAAVWMIPAAVFFSLQSAVFSVLLEWFCPIRNWKTESDLWHHPRKYLVPAVMLLLAGAVGTMPTILPLLTALLAAEIFILLLCCRTS